MILIEDYTEVEEFSDSNQHYLLPKHPIRLLIAGASDTGTLLSSDTKEFITVDDLDPSCNNVVVFDDCNTDKDQKSIEDFFVRAALSLSVGIVEVLHKALNIAERKEEYKQLLNLYKSREISEEEVYRREEDFVNNLVHLPREKRGNQATFTEEIFAISEVLKTDPITYKIKDLYDEDVKGIFYEKELVKYDKKDNVYKIEKIIKKVGNKYLVKWLDYPVTSGEMCSLAYVCENLTPVLEYLGNDHPRLFADVRRFFLACLDQMYGIVFTEENDDLQEEDLEDSDDVLSIRDKLV
ncbi:uncharacterized transposon-derived protein F54H12.3 [Trichonephila clavipes]|nr:uncharacterized transposon-derived protein F54H12.3 [Trichonephila clavipes]